MVHVFPTAFFWFRRSSAEDLMQIWWQGAEEKNSVEKTVEHENNNKAANI